MKKLMFVALILAAGISFADNYSPSKVPTGATSPDVMPGTVNFQGLLRDPATGNPYKDGIYTLECRLYTALTGTKAIWGAKYQAYVREGYFNIMLGSTGTPLSGCTYPNPTDLWKALWYNGSNRELYLGVTPWQGADGQTIADADKRKEITPRQQLLAAPFALRAQKAQYADEAPHDFYIPGDLRVAGQILNADDSAFSLKNITAGDDKIEIGSENSPAATMVKGKAVTIESGERININPGTSMLVSMNASKMLKIEGNSGFLLCNGLSQLLGSTDYAYLGWDTLNGNGPKNYGLVIDKNAKNAELVAPTVALKARAIGSSTVSSSLKVANGEVSGEGKLKWKRPSYNAAAPIIYRTVVVEMSANTSHQRFFIQNLVGEVDATSYCWSVAGYAILESGLNETQWRSPELRILRCLNNLYVDVGLDAYSSVKRKFRVQLMGVNKNWCDDGRSSEPEDDYELYDD